MLGFKELSIPSRVPGYAPKCTRSEVLGKSIGSGLYKLVITLALYDRNLYYIRTKCVSAFRVSISQLRFSCSAQNLRYLRGLYTLRP